MILNLADETALEIKSISFSGDDTNAVTILLDTKCYTEVKSIFHDATKTAVMSTETDQFEHYTTLKSFTAAELDNETDEVRIELVYEADTDVIESLQNEIESMQECIMELGDRLYNQEV